MYEAIIILKKSADTCEQNPQQLTNKVREELVKRRYRQVQRMFLLIKKRPVVKQTQQFVKKRMRLRQMATDVKSPKQWTVWRTAPEKNRQENKLPDNRWVTNPCVSPFSHVTVFDRASWAHTRYLACPTVISCHPIRDLDLAGQELPRK